MADLLLEARIQALDDNLRRLETSVELCKRLYSSSWRKTDLWKKLGDAVEQGVQDCDAKLGQARLKLTPPADAPLDEAVPSPSEAWRLFEEAQARSGPLFRGCLEFIGGVAFRRPGQSEEEERDAVAEQVWLVADQLMREAASDCFAADWDFLTVPALEEALSDSLTRTVRLRFPEWTIWTLPLLAYDLGLVAIQQRLVLDKRLLRELVRSEGERLVSEDDELKRRAAEAPPEAVTGLERAATQRWENHVRVLLADAFATYAMGPAYACAAIYLRFDPTAAFSGNPSYDERASIVLWALKELDANERHEAFTRSLETAWQSAVESTEPRDPPDRATRVDEKLRLAFAEQLDRSVPSAGRYEPARWLRAEMIEATWKQALDGNKPLPHAEEAEKLRDVLNAAWLCRINGPLSAGEQRLTTVTNAALDACLDLIERQEEGALVPSERRRRGRGARAEVRGV